jgi:protein-disulfide isomerase
LKKETSSMRVCERSRPKHRVAVLATLAMAACLGIAALAGRGAAAPAGQASSTPKPAATTTTAHKALETPLAAPVKTYGSKSAPITLELFTDYECPTCRDFYERTLRYVISDYVTAGKVYILHHDYPLVMHTYSGEAARWAEAAATIGQFAPVEATLYDNQAAWTADGNIGKFVASSMPSADFKKVDALMKSCAMPAPQAKSIGADPMAGIARGCPVDSFIADDIKAGDKIPIQGTPTYIIYYKGQKLPAGSGFVSWPVLKQFFDSLLAQH